jgi:hypothetical protein
VGEDILRGRHARVGADEQLLQLEPELLVDAGALEEAGDAAEPGATGALEGGLDGAGRGFDKLSLRGFDALVGLLLGLGGAAEQAD